MTFQNKLRCDSGATAVEYAIIAALIGLGLVGSLVTTRTSLSAIFGTTGTQMSSAASDAPAGVAPGFTSTSPRVAFWNAKTLAREPTVATQTNGSATTSYTFTDGTTVDYYKSFNGYSSIVYRQGDTGIRYSFLASGPIDIGSLDTYVPGTNNYSKQEFSYPTNNNVTTTYTNTWSGNSYVQTEAPASAAYKTATANSIEDIKIFAAGRPKP